MPQGVPVSGFARPHYRDKDTISQLFIQPFASIIPRSAPGSSSATPAGLSRMSAVPTHYTYRCLSCWKSFSGIEALLKHRAPHREDKRYSCEDFDVMGTLKATRQQLHDWQYMKYRAVEKAKLGSTAGGSADGAAFLHCYPLRHPCLLRSQRCIIDIADRTQLQHNSLYRSPAIIHDMTRPLLPSARPTGPGSA